MIEITGSLPEAVMHICCNMRPADKEEVFALRWSDSPLDLAEDMMHLRGPQWVAWLNAEPVALIGAHLMWPNLWSVYAFGTKKFQQVGLPLTRHVRRVMMPGLKIVGALRAQCLSLSTHTEAHRWLESLNARKESVLPKYGRNGEDFVMYSWTEESQLVHGRR